MLEFYGAEINFKVFEIANFDILLNKGLKTCSKNLSVFYEISPDKPKVMLLQN